MADQVTPDEFKAFIVYVQEVENENLVLKNEKAADEQEKEALREALEDTRERVRTLELLLEKKDDEIMLHIDEKLMWKQQAAEYKFLYENDRPSAFEKMATKFGVGASVAAFIYFVVQAIN